MTARRRVLFVAADVPWPPDGGGRIASLRVLEGFCASHDVDLVALADPMRRVSYEPLRAICRRVCIVPHPFSFSRHPYRQSLTALRSVASREPYRLRKFRSSPLARTLREWKAETPYELIHHEQFGVAQYVDHSIPSTALVQNVESEIYRRGQQVGGRLARAWATIEGRKLTKREPQLLARFDEVFVLTESDRARLRAEHVDRVSVVPMPAPAPAAPRDPPTSPVILSLGSMTWFGVAEGLTWFHDMVLPLVRLRVPGVTWELIGPGAPSMIQQYGRELGVVLHGYVPEVEPYLSKARVAIIPLRVAGGIRMKLLDLMAAGLPAVSTTVGGEGITFADGEGCFREDDPAAFAEALVRLLTNDELWRTTADRGRAFIAQTHTGADLRDALRAGVERAIAQFRGRTDGDVSSHAS